MIADHGLGIARRGLELGTGRSKRSSNQLGVLCGVMASPRAGWGSKRGDDWYRRGLRRQIVGGPELNFGYADNTTGRFREPFQASTLSGDVFTLFAFKSGREMLAGEECAVRLRRWAVSGSKAL